MTQTHKTGKGKTPAQGTVRVRMYRLGLGDCFLLSFEGTDRPMHVLIDCGVLLGQPGGAAKIREVVRDIAETTRPAPGMAPHLDLLVVTHEHWDHISGFLQAQEQFDEFEIERLWMGWTENPKDKRAQRLKREYGRKKEALALALEELRNTNQVSELELADRIQSVIGFGGDAGMDGANVLGVQGTTGDALNYLKTRADISPEYLKPGGKPWQLDGLPGVRFYVLGPPEDETLLLKDLPSGGADAETYQEQNENQDRYDAFAAAVQDAHSSVSLHSLEERRRQQLNRPFDDHYRFSPEKIKKAPLSKIPIDLRSQYEFFQETYLNPLDHWRRIDNDWLGAATDLALDLDSKTNNTSLALAIELENGRVLLFPGDAQVGNWLSWEQCKFHVAEGGGKTRTVTGPELLKRTVFYKVGHHASHNATLCEKGLELMDAQDLAAMIPVDEAVAKKQGKKKKDGGKGWKMPFGPLAKRLEDKAYGRVLRADRTWPKPDSACPDRLSLAKWKKFLGDVIVEPNGLYFELIIK